jgi:hypothetical protein
MNLVKVYNIHELKYNNETPLYNMVIKKKKTYSEEDLKQKSYLSYAVPYELGKLFHLSETIFSQI